MKDEGTKSKIKESLLNQLIDPDKYQAVISYRAGPVAVERSRQRVQSMVASSIATVSQDVPTYTSERSSSHSMNTPTHLTFEYVEFKLTENVDGDATEIRGIVSKAMEYVNEKKVIPISYFLPLKGQIFWPPVTM